MRGRMTIRASTRLAHTALMLATVSLGCLAASDAAAQESAQPPEAGIADIVVTANKRSESMQKVPIAITAVTSDRLAQVDRKEQTSELQSLMRISYAGFCLQ